MSEPEIVPFRTELRADFERLNRVWLEGYGLLEDADLEYLQDPEGHILEKGGEVYFALLDGRAVGTCAAIPVDARTVELAKLSVDPALHGRGLGRRLAQAVLDFARALGATEVVLTSQHGLSAAIRLYESMGFRHAPLPPDIRYVTADVYMTLSLEARP